MFKKFRNEKTHAAFHEIVTTCFQFLKAQVIMFLANIVLLTVGLLILGLKWWAFPIALGTAVIDFLPVLGTGAVFIPWVIYNFYVADYKMAIGLIILFVVINAFELVLEPVLCSKSVGLSPLTTLASSFVGIFIFGATGIILGPLCVVIIRIIQKYIYSEPTSE